MLKTEEEKLPKRSGVGVIVARMQVAELTAGHEALIESVIARHSRTIIILGTNGAGASTENNPLDFRTRQLMINSVYDVQVGHVKDGGTNESWSRDLDQEIRNFVSISSDVTLYGSRDSFIPHYSGSFNTKILTALDSESGTESRKAISETADKSSAAFRQGVIWATQNQYPTVYPVVDVAIIKEGSDYDLVLLGKKPGEDLWRFPGGFVDVKKEFAAEALEATVRREAQEETCLSVGDVKYLGSFFTEDGRYANESDCMMTVFFTAKYQFGGAKAGDDLSEVRWFPLIPETVKAIGPKTHIKMFDVLIKSREGKQNDSV